ncbi:MAG: SLC13 family permease [Phycisphaeraceae bacterium]
MIWEAWITLGVVAGMIALLASNRVSTDLVFFAGLALLVALAEITGTTRLPSTAAAVAGFGNEGLITVAVLYVVVSGLVQTGGMSLIAQPLLGRPRTVTAATIRLMFPVAGVSAFLNNTPAVAMFLPVVSDLCRKLHISPSKLFIPLSYAAILGGVCTLIGTSTNLVVHGLLIEATRGSDAPARLGMFDITWVGLPCALAGMAFVVLLGRWLLPQRKAPISLGDDPRQYTVEMIVDPASALVGQSIEQAGLRHLPGLYLMEIHRGQDVLSAVAPRERLAANDRLVFVGIVESVVDLQKVRGLTPATNQVFKLDSPRAERRLIEAVVSDACPLVGKSIRGGRFRNTYNAAVIAVARGGERIARKVGDIVLRAGDTLLLEAHPSFVDEQRNRRDFYLVSAIDDSAPPRHERAWIALLILAAMVVVAALSWLTMLNAAMLAAVLMIVTGCCSISEARRSIDWEVLIVIGAALGIGAAMSTTGVADVLAREIITIAGPRPWLALLAVYAVTLVLTELMSNNAAAALMFPITMATAASLTVNYMPFVIIIMIAASCGFATPIGYQTNLMVYGPGGYRFSDYLRIGVPLDLLIMAIAVTLTPVVFPF